MALEMTSKVETDQQKFVTGQLGNRVESNLVPCFVDYGQTEGSNGMNVNLNGGVK